ncbi:MAG: uracil-DNA glycosylase [Caulobacterales bacterium 32-69-10]|nr:MAG: uracil-DNA glycosylase [Caulobacterales bacterium 32-69-10]
MALDALIDEIRACRACAGDLPHEPRPVVRVSPATRLLICGQAPGRRVHEICFPGTNPKGGDYPPPPRCANLWRGRLTQALPKAELTLLVGGYAQKWALGARAKADMTQTVAAWREYGPDLLPMPHPSWRNTAWLRRNPWFEDEVVPYLQFRVAGLLGSGKPA